MPKAIPLVQSEPKPDYTAPSFRGALMRDHWDTGREMSMVESASIHEIQRASIAINVIARLVHNSLCEPQMSGAEPLGQPAHLGLLNAMEIIGKHLGEVADTMTRSGDVYAKFEEERGESR